MRLRYKIQSAIRAYLGIGVVSQQIVDLDFSLNHVDANLPKTLIELKATNEVLLKTFNSAMYNRNEGVFRSIENLSSKVTELIQLTKSATLPAGAEVEALTKGVERELGEMNRRLNALSMAVGRIKQ